MFKLRLFRKTFLFVTSFYLVSCATIESTFDSTVESISEAGDYIYNTVNFWDDETDEPEQSEAIIIEEAGGKVNDLNAFEINNVDIRAASSNIYLKMLEKLKNF